MVWKLESLMQYLSLLNCDISIGASFSMGCKKGHYVYMSKACMRKLQASGVRKSMCKLQASGVRKCMCNLQASGVRKCISKFEVV